jgi:hypothetical protein
MVTLLVVLNAHHYAGNRHDIFFAVSGVQRLRLIGQGHYCTKCKVIP